jgi:UDP-glucose 4-epimerase
MFNASNPINIIGPRHGEKMYETLCGKEEMAKAVDMGDFFRIPADYRDLNYTKYVQKDFPKLVNHEYNSDNTTRLNMEELKLLLLSLDYVQNELNTK